MQIAEKTVLITGANRGVGEALVILLLQGFQHIPKCECEAQ